MNKHCYRVIFNKKSGRLTAVSELATGGQSAACHTAQGGGSVVLTFRHLAVAIALLCGGMQIVQAQIVADPNAIATKQPVVNMVTQAPVVQIVAPNSAGVSHNQYQQFNIGQPGAVLSNNTGTANTHLAGQISANPQLTQTGPAKIIINEVTSNQASALNGYLEVAGQRADVVISNPNGITVGRFGLINAQRGVLTTGTPLFGGTGSLDAFRVNGGQITVADKAQFNDAGTEQVDLIARSVQVNGKIWVNKLNVVTGANTVNYQDLGVSVIDSKDKAPMVAIDVAKLGGMYANKIMLVGTEQGVGVHQQGELVAKEGEFTVNAKGDVVLAGHVRAQGNIDVHGATVSTKGTVLGHQKVTMQAQDAMQIDGHVHAVGDMALTSGKAMTIHGDVASQGKIDLTSAANVVHDHGTINSNKMTTINADAVNNTAKIYAGELTINAKSDVVNSGKDAVMYSRWKTYIGTAQFTNEKSALFQSDNGAVISGNTVDNNSNTKHIVNNGATMDIGGALLLYADVVDNINNQFTADVGQGQWLPTRDGGTRYNAEMPDPTAPSWIKHVEYSSAQAEIRDNGHYQYLYVFETQQTAEKYTIINYTSDQLQAPVATSSVPGVMKVQGNLYYYGQTLTNDKSTMQLGGHLLINDKERSELPDVLHQIDALGPARLHDVGTVQFHSTRGCGFNKTCNDFFKVKPFDGQHYQDVAMHVEQFKDEAKPERTTVKDSAREGVVFVDMAKFDDAAPALSYYAIQHAGPKEVSLIDIMASDAMKQRYIAEQHAKKHDVHVDLDQQYHALIAAGVAYGKVAHLVPGKTLTASQKAALPEDIIWLVAHSVTMPNGQIASVMTPVLFSAR